MHRSTTSINGATVRPAKWRLKNRWQQFIIMLVVLLCACMTSPVYGQSVGTFLDQDTLERCLQDADQADENMNMKLSAEDYVIFINLYSRGQVDATRFQDLPLRLVIIYHWIACFCTLEPDADMDCCVKDNSHIPLDNSTDSQESLLLMCSQTYIAIDETYESPTMMPSVSRSPSQAPIPPTLSPTRSSIPSHNPSYVPSVTETVILSPSPTEMPSQQTNAPTTSIIASPSPTEMPSQQTNAPTTSIIASPSPTEMPSQQTNAPTTSIIASPSPTEIPSQQTNAPTISISPTPTPTIMPSYSPSTATNRPTVESLLCITFQYSVRNDENVTASMILDEDNNTLKNRLILATEITLGSVLNETFPQAGRSVGLTSISSSRYDNVMPDLSHVLSTGEDRTPNREYSPLLDLWEGGHDRRLYSPDKLTAAVEYAAIDALGGDQSAYDMVQQDLAAWRRDNRRSRRSHGDFDNSHNRARRLVYYTQDFPVEILSATDAPLVLCDGASETDASRCAIITSQICVVLGPQDDPDRVRQLLVVGMSDAFNSGEFENNLVPVLPSERL